MMEIPIFQVDAFASEVFSGNPAAVCPLDNWLSDSLMQSIAMENNLSETAFFVPVADDYDLRWFTPVSEVALCGHATLAAAHVLFNHLDFPYPLIRFNTLSGMLHVSGAGNGRLNMNFPAFPAEEIYNDPAYESILGIRPLAAFRAGTLMLLYPDEQSVRAVKPDFRHVKTLDDVGVIITSPGDQYDFVSRFFAPAVGIDEDPVTGSAHSSLIPFWCRRLGRRELTAFQCSERGGIVYCRDEGERVIIGGNAVTFLAGTLFI
jgi:PhzF family phenazine biosynthesis protein